jgi:polyribonucleotide nucleotidyltransferase
MSMNTTTEVAKVGSIEISFETGKLAKQTNAVVIRCGGTAVLVSALASKEPKALPFLPLTVEYREPNYAGGKIPGGYFKREGRPTDPEILTCRLIDRPIRPLFPEEYKLRQCRSTCRRCSHDKVNEPDIVWR